jgi:hypothetical protein
MLDWSTTLAAGAGGGLIVEAIVFFGNVTSWQEARRQARGARNTTLPGFGDHIDPIPDVLVALTRMVIGAAAGMIFHGQIDGIPAAIAIGAAGPALLRQFGSTQSVKQALRGTDQLPPADHAASGGQV